MATTVSKGKAKPKKKEASAKAAAKSKTNKAKAKTKSSLGPKTQEKPAALSGSSFVPYGEAPNEEYMSTGQLEHFRNILSGWKEGLMREVDKTVNHMQDESTNLPDPADRASQEEEFTFELRTRDRERKLIKKIDQALDLIEQGEYGFCEACGVEIGIKRLEARPTATLCIDCKTLDEIKEKQIKG